MGGGADEFRGWRDRRGRTGMSRGSGAGMGCDRVFYRASLECELLPGRCIGSGDIAGTTTAAAAAAAAAFAFLAPSAEGSCGECLNWDSVVNAIDLA